MSVWKYREYSSASSALSHTMRIGIDATSIPPHPGGAGNYIIQLIHNLVEMDEFRSGKDTLVVFAQKNGQALIAENGYDTQPARKVSSARKYSSATADHHLEWVIIPTMRPPIRLAWEQFSLPGLVRSHNLDLLHSTHYTRPFFLTCRSVVTFHDMTFFLYPQLHTRAKRAFFPSMIRISARRADILIASSESTRQDALRLLDIPPEKIQTIHLGVGQEFHPIADLQALEAVQNRYKLPAKFILYVGTVEPRKNLPLLLKSYSQINSLSDSLLKDSFFLPLVIVGQMGWNYQEVLNQVQNLGLQDHIQFTGYIPASDLPIMYNLAEFFVYPSLYEGFGLPPLEALACGTPVITSAVSSMPEHVGDCGFLVPPNDPNALSSAIQQLENDEEKRLLFRTKGPQQASNFTWKRTAQQTLQLYHKLAAVNK